MTTEESGRPSSSSRDKKAREDCYQLGRKTNCHSSHFSLSGVLGGIRVIFIIINKRNQGKTSYHRSHLKLLPDFVSTMRGHCVLKVFNCIHILRTTMSSEIADIMP